MENVPSWSWEVRDAAFVEIPGVRGWSKLYRQEPALILPLTLLILIRLELAFNVYINFSIGNRIELLNGG